MQGTENLPENIQKLLDRYWQRLTEKSAFADYGIDELIKSSAGFCAELEKVWISSEFVANATIANPELLQDIYKRRKDPPPLYSELLPGELKPLAELEYKSGSDKLKSILRHYHRLEFLLIIWRDICGYADVHTICRQMSDLADTILDQTLSILYSWSVKEMGTPMAGGNPQYMVVLGMGKLGARELNVSSDIDLIFAYPQTGETESVEDSTETLTNQQFFTRLGQRLIDAIDTTTADGFVFRVDMRLRPYGGEGALVMGFEATEDYYQNHGRDWERYAMVKARAIAGNVEQGQLLLQQLKPFIYRRYLDFSMFESLRGMKEQIERQARKFNLETDIKLGPGGIREVEFTVQALQLVYGGRDNTLQQTSLIKALERLVSGDYLTETDANELTRIYENLRNLEHKLQSFSNQQTQKLPESEETQQRVAIAAGYGDWNNLTFSLEADRNRVRYHFNEVLGAPTSSQDSRLHAAEWSPVWQLELEDEKLIQIFRSSGFESPEDSLKLLKEFRKEKKFLLLPATSRDRLNRFMPVLLNAVVKTEKPSLCLERVMALVESVSRRTAYLVLLLENPQALDQLVLYCTASPLISDYLSKYPVLLDELLNVIDKPPERDELADELHQQLMRIDTDSFEDQLECLRYFKQSHLLKVAAAEVSGILPLMKVSDYLTFTAEVVLDAVLSLAWQFLVSRHGFPVHTDGSSGNLEFAIVGYGKLGGIELGYGSDLDLVFLHQASLDEDTLTSGGQRAINSRAFYIKLAQRIILTLGTITVSGKLYEVDMRLRPSGDSGLLVSSIESYEEYQSRKAWVWEHQALVRARGIAGSNNLLHKFSLIRGEVLSRKRDIGELAKDVTDMRVRMRKELSAQSSSALDKNAFEIKQRAGGIVDIEFMVQFMVLAYSNQFPELLTYTDNFRILEIARKNQLLDKNDMEALIDAYMTLRAASHRLSLTNESAGEPRDLEVHFDNVSAIWHKTFAFLKSS